MAYADIIVERSEHALEIILNRPNNLNAMREQTAAEIVEAMAEVESDRQIVAVILRGGERAFCTGVDTSEFREKPEERFDVYRARKRARKMGTMMRFVMNYTKPVVSVIEGLALGGGLELAMFGDIIVCGEGAELGLPEARLGLMPGGGGTQNLPRLIGAPLAKELMWTGRRIPAAEAKEYRLCNHVVPKGQGLDKAREIVAQIAKNSQLSVMMIKQAVSRGLDMSLANGFATETDISFLLTFADDREEGVRAFREKRKPNFKGS